MFRPCSHQRTPTATAGHIFGRRTEKQIDKMYLKINCENCVRAVANESDHFLFWKFEGEKCLMR